MNTQQTYNLQREAKHTANRQQQIEWGKDHRELSKWLDGTYTAFVDNGIHYLVDTTTGEVIDSHRVSTYTTTYRQSVKFLNTAKMEMYKVMSKSEVRIFDLLERHLKKDGTYNMGYKDIADM